MEIGENTQWDDNGKITEGINTNTRVMVDGKWFKVTGINPSDKNRLAIQLENGSGIIFGDNTKGSETDQTPKTTLGDELVATNRAAYNLTLGADKKVTGEISNYLSNPSYNFSTSIAWDPRNATVTSNGYAELPLVKHSRGEGADAYDAGIGGLTF